MADVGLYRTNSDGDACTTDSRESYNALSCYESISATVSQNFVGWNMMLGYTRTQNNTDDSLRWDKQQTLKITIFARQQRKVSLKLYNLALPALL